MWGHFLLKYSKNWSKVWELPQKRCQYWVAWNSWQPSPYLVRVTSYSSISWCKWSHLPAFINNTGPDSRPVSVVRAALGLLCDRRLFGSTHNNNYLPRKPNVLCCARHDSQVSHFYCLYVIVWSSWLLMARMVHSIMINNITRPCPGCCFTPIRNVLQAGHAVKINQ